VPRFALHRQGQDSHVCPRWHAMACRGLTLVGPKRVGLGYRRAGLNVQPSTDRWKRFLPARSDRVSTVVTHGGRAATGKDENARSMTTSPCIPPGYFLNRSQMTRANSVTNLRKDIL
jgi:hypothetical protein